MLSFKIIVLKLKPRCVNIVIDRQGFWGLLCKVRSGKVPELTLLNLDIAVHDFG